MAFRWDTALITGGVFAAARVDAGAIYYVGLAVIVVILVGTLIAFYRTWVEIHEDDEPDSPQDLMESFREAHAAGQIDDGELERVRRLLLSGEGDVKGASARTPPLQSVSTPEMPEGALDPTDPNAIEPRSG
jgi:hypothetical protein